MPHRYTVREGKTRVCRGRWVDGATDDSAGCLSLDGQLKDDARYGEVDHQAEDVDQ